MWSSFAYHEPTSTQIVILLSFLSFLNLGGAVAQRYISAGSLGQIFVGIVYGTPLAGILEESWEEAIVAIGYVGSLLVVFEGGMSSSISNSRSLLPLSSAIASTGSLAPIALSFILIPLGPSPPLHAFAAGSALSSTSLGTVSAVLHPATIGFDSRKTALGTALLSAAVMDDIVAFILVKVLTILGSGEQTSGSYLGKSIARAVGVTIGLGLVMVVMARWVLKPGYAAVKSSQRLMNATWGGQRLLLVLMAILFIGMVAAAGYGGTSPLFGAYIAGSAIAYSSDPDSPDTAREAEVIELKEPCLPIRLGCRRNTFPTTARPLAMGASSTALARSDSIVPPVAGSIETFEHYIAPVLTYLLLPLFFGSIGYSIPFVPSWTGRVIWRGIIYALLMFLGKAFCGAWMLLRGRRGWRAVMLLGLAMVSRGEIGLLIAQVARGTSDPLLDEDEFLVVVWAIVLCTIVGPASVGGAVNRWNKRISRGGWD